MTIARAIPALLSLALVAGACGGEENAMMPQPDPCDATVDPQATLSCDVQPIFTANCALSGCHAAPNPAEGQNLSAGQAFGNTVNVPSQQVARLFRVEPGNADSSYLVIKIEGEAGQVGGMATQMPLGMAPLSRAQIDTIRSWIDAGAMNN